MTVHWQRCNLSVCRCAVIDRNPWGYGCELVYAREHGDNDKASAATAVEHEVFKPTQYMVGLVQGWGITSRASIPTIR